MTSYADGGGMTRHSERHAIINSPGTRRLAAEIRTLRRRDTALDDTVANIRNGDNHAMQTVITSAQRGDADAAATALWALLPRLSSVVLSRRPPHAWRASIDDYLTIAYLTLLDVDVTAPPTFLSDKIVARARRRYERAERRGPEESQGPEVLDRHEAPHSSVEDEALARIAMHELADAVAGGAVSTESWETLVKVRFQLPPGQASARDRKVASRARQRLTEWLAVAA